MGEAEGLDGARASRRAAAAAVSRRQQKQVDAAGRAQAMARARQAARAMPPPASPRGALNSIVETTALASDAEDAEEEEASASDNGEEVGDLRAELGAVRHQLSVLRTTHSTLQKEHGALQACLREVTDAAAQSAQAHAAAEAAAPGDAAPRGVESGAALLERAAMLQSERAALSTQLKLKESQLATVAAAAKRDAAALELKTRELAEVKEWAKQAKVDAATLKSAAAEAGTRERRYSMVAAQREAQVAAVKVR